MRSFRLSCSGQAATEYALALAFLLVFLVTVPDMVLSALSRHYQEIVSLLALPIP